MIVSFVITILVQFIRLLVVADMTVMKVGDYIRNVVIPIIFYTALSLLFPLPLCRFLPEGWLRLILVLVVSVVSSLCFAWLVGLNKMEKAFVLSKIKSIKYFNRFIK